MKDTYLNASKYLNVSRIRFVDVMVYTRDIVYYRSFTDLCVLENLDKMYKSYDYLYVRYWKLDRVRVLKIKII